MSQQFILYNPNNSKVDLPLVATGLRTFTTGRETKRKNEKDAGFTLVQSTNRKTMHYINL